LRRFTWFRLRRSRSWKRLGKGGDRRRSRDRAVDFSGCGLPLLHRRRRAVALRAGMPGAGWLGCAGGRARPWARERACACPCPLSSSVHPAAGKRKGTDGWTEQAAGSGGKERTAAGIWMHVITVSWNNRILFQVCGHGTMIPLATEITSNAFPSPYMSSTVAVYRWK
jgi:hypothetical protein